MSAAASQTAAANQARRTRTEEKLRRVAAAIGQLQRRKLPVTYPAIASRAGVSRTFLYDNPPPPATWSPPPSPAPTASARTTRLTGTPRRRLPGSSGLNAEQALKAAHAEIRAQRARMGDLLGQLRDTHREHDGDAIERLTSDNAAPKQRVRDLTAQQRTLEERLQAARSNNRFLDKRIAGLEAQLLAAQPGS